MPHRTVLSRRVLLNASAAATAALVTGVADPVVAAEADHRIVTAPSVGTAAADKATTAFVADYRTNVMANVTAETNAAVRILSGMQRLWRTGAAWNTGSVLARDVLHANMRYAARVTHARTPEQAARAFILDRQHQSYAVIAGLGPLAEIYRTGARAVTSITSAPDGTPEATINDAVPVGAPVGSAIGAGSPTSPLGAVVALVNTVRGPYSSGNPGKYAYLYPRPWRMTADSTVVTTGAVDALGYPVYRSDVIVVPQLLRQRNLNPADDGGFPSGHTNAFHLAALALAYAIPERFQELVTAAYDMSDSRIVAGMHSPVDVIGGRILATALAAAILADPANAELKAQAREQAATYLRSRVGDDLFGYAHCGGFDPYADRPANKRVVEPKRTYGLPFGRQTATMAVPQGAEVLLETRLPYLDVAQRRQVLATTATAGGCALLDGPEQWGRLDLFAAADGYGAFARDVVVAMDATAGGFCAADSWRNDIDGPGGLVKRGTGTLTLTGTNRYRGGTTLLCGGLTADSANALGTGAVVVAGGVLRVATNLRVHDEYRQSAGTVAVTVRKNPVLEIDGTAVLGPRAVLAIEVAPGARPGPITVLRARRVRGVFDRVTVTTPGWRAETSYSRTAVTVRLHRC